MLSEFSLLLMSKYPNAGKAFKAFDLNNNGTLSAAEFTGSVSGLRYSGDATAVFKALDLDRLGDISMSEFQRLQEKYNKQTMVLNE